MAFKVHVVDSKDRPVAHVGVTLSFSGIFRGHSSEEFTDSDGIAYFSGYEDGPVDIYVRGKKRDSAYYRDGGSVTVQV